MNIRKYIVIQAGNRNLSFSYHTHTSSFINTKLNHFTVIFMLINLVTVRPKDRHQIFYFAKHIVAEASTRGVLLNKAVKSS